MFVRPRRTATLRTRLDVGALRARLQALLDEPAPAGWKAVLADHAIRAGQVGVQDFVLSYHYSAPRNPQTYEVRGAFVETPDWRLVRLRIKARDPWMTGWFLAMLALAGAYFVYMDGGRPRAGLLSVAAVVAIYAVVNLLVIPDIVAERVSALLAKQIHGSVQHGARWIVPD